MKLHFVCLHFAHHFHVQYITYLFQKESMIYFIYIADTRYKQERKYLNQNN